MYERDPGGDGLQGSSRISVKDLRAQNSESSGTCPKLSQKSLPCLLIILCSILSFFSLSEQVSAKPEVPERFVYYVYWSGIRAGMATFVSERTSEGLTIQSRATSATFISLFYKVEDIARSTLYKDKFPVSYILKVREGRHRRDRAVYFGVKPERGPQKVTFTNRLKKENKVFHLEKQAFDPLSGFYEIRKRPLKIGTSEYLDVFDSKKLWNVEVKVLRKEHIQIPSGEFDTIVIKPLLRSEGLFMKKGEFTIWLTDDDKRIPVMVKSKVKIGNFTAKLIEGGY